MPAPPLRGQVLLAVLTASVSIVAASAAAQVTLGTSITQPIVAAAALGREHPFPTLGPANRVTIARAALVALAASVVAEPPAPPLAWTLAGLTLLFAALDGVDGWLARRSRISSDFGARFDMETDALFMLVLSVLVWRHGKAGVWVVGIGAMRYAFVAAGWLLPWLARPLRGSIRGKTVAVVQMVVLGAALVPVIPASLSRSICAGALGALVWSFAVDVRFLWRGRKSHAR